MNLPLRALVEGERPVPGRLSNACSVSRRKQGCYPQVFEALVSCYQQPFDRPGRTRYASAAETGSSRLRARLYLEGLSSSDFEPAFRELLGKLAPLSGSTIPRLKDEWTVEGAGWRVHPLPPPQHQLHSPGV
jgi:hypothetical protein